MKTQQTPTLPRTAKAPTADQPLRISYGAACDLLDLSREGLRKLIKRDETFPRPIKNGEQKQAAVFFDYEELMQWHEGKKNGRVTEKADPFLLMPRAPITPTEPTFSAPPMPSADPSTLLDSTISLIEKLKIEAVATAAKQPVVDALCDVCGQPTAQWVVAQNAAVIQELNEELMARGRKIRLLEADKAVLTTENEKLNRELMHPDTGGNEDGYWGFVILLLAIVASFGLGCVVGGAV